jgi:hypothetical protein
MAELDKLFNAVYRGSECTWKLGMSIYSLEPLNNHKSLLDVEKSHVDPRNVFLYTM